MAVSAHTIDSSSSVRVRETNPEASTAQPGAGAPAGKRTTA